MQKLHLVIVLLIILNSCSNSNIISLSKDNEKKWQMPDIEGDWNFVDAEMIENPPLPIQLKASQPIVDEATPLSPPYIGPDLRFAKDTLYELNYPISINNRMKFSIDSGYLITHLGHQVIEHYPIENKNDTLCIYKWYDGETYIKESYVKTNLNDSIMRILKTYGVNYPELAGTWLLLREDSGNDGSEYTLKFPFNIPDSIKLSREELIQVTKNNMVYWMSTSGKKRDYILSYWWGNLHLTPGKWYKKEDPWIHFYKVEN